MAKENNKSLFDFEDISDELLIAEYDEVAADLNITPKLREIFIAILKEDRTLFPKIKLGKNVTYQNYISKWISNYIDADRNPPSKRLANPKGSCSDPAIKTIVQYAMEIDDHQATKQEQIHNLFMSAENIQGNLLEEYIDSIASDHGWFWCKGNILQATDFCTEDGVTLLQIKNKSNTENSSSSKIRTGTSIKKWYRLGTKTVNKEKVPVFKWESLNEIINSYRPEVYSAVNLNEEDYSEFLKNIVSVNQKIINDK